MTSEWSDLLDSAIELAGEHFEMRRGNVSQTVEGVKHAEKGTLRKYVSFRPGTDIKVGDTLHRKVSGDEWQITEVDPHVIEGQVYSVNAYYETDYDYKQKNLAQTPSVSYSFHNSSNIIAGNQTNAKITVNLSHIGTEINERGGSDKEELRAMVQAIKEAFEQRDSLQKGSLVKYSEMIEKHSWIAGSLVQLLGSAAIQFLMGK